KIVDSIELSKQQPFSRVLFGLNIPDVGWVTARNLARHFGNVDRLLDASMDDIQDVEGIGPDRAESSAGGSKDGDHRALVRAPRSSRRRRRPAYPFSPRRICAACSSASAPSIYGRRRSNSAYSTRS